MSTPQAAATTKAKASSSFRGSTFTIHSLVRTDTSTLLTFSVTGGADSSARDQVATGWTNYPILSTTTQRFVVVTYEKNPGTSNPYAAVSNPTLGLKVGKPTAPAQGHHERRPDQRLVRHRHRPRHRSRLTQPGQVGAATAQRPRSDRAATARRPPRPTGTPAPLVTVTV